MKWLGQRKLEGLSCSPTSLGCPIQPLCHHYSQHCYYFFWLLLTEHLLHAGRYAKSFASIFPLYTSSQQPQTHFTTGETEALGLAPCGTVRKWQQSPGAHREFLVSSFQHAEENTSSMPPPAYSLFRPPLLIPHTSLPSPKVTPPSPVLDVQDNLKSIY